MGDERVLPPMPPSSARSRTRTTSNETDFWAGLFTDLSVRIEWLGQALDAVPKSEASVAALVRMRSYAHAVDELQLALERVQAYRADPRLKPLYSLDGPLAGYLSRLYGWCEEIGNDFERMAAALRRREPTSIVFSHKEVNDSYAHFGELVAAMRRQYEIAYELHGSDDGAVWRAFDEALEELVWANEWVHMTLARAPGS
jgi:hypothetical protein